MMLSARIRLAFLLGLVCFAGPASAQVPSTTLRPSWEQVSEDLPRSSQRILPLPSGQPSVLEQIELLERLNNLAGDEQPSTAPLTESQLKMLDRVVNSFRNEAGELNLPNLNMLPAGMLEKLMSDPAQRQQARRLLEQYARQRNLGIPGTNPNLPFIPNSSSKRSSNNPFQTAEEQAADNSRRNAPGSSELGQPSSPPNISRRDIRQPSNRQPNFAEPNFAEPNLAEPSLAEPRNRQPATPKELSAIEELVKNLRMIDQAQQKAAANQNNSKSNKTQSSPGATAGQSNSRATPSRTPRTAQSATARNNQPANPQARSNRLQPPATAPNGQLYPNMPPIPNTFPPMPEVAESEPTLAQRDPAQPDANQNSELEPFVNDRTFKLELDDSDRLDPFGENSTRRSQPESRWTSNPFAEPSTKKNSKSEPQRSFRVRDLAERLPPSSAAGQGNGQPGISSGNTPATNNSSPSSNSLMQSLRGLVNKALKEQGHDERSAGQLLRETTRGLIPGNKRTDENTNANATPDNLALQAGSLSQGSGQGSQSASPSSGSNSSSSAMVSAATSTWRSLAGEVWKAISTAPTVTSETTPPSRTFGSSSSASLPELFNMRVLSVIAVAALAIAVIYWLARRGQTNAVESRDAHERWVRDVLTYGLKTRADVVRAFHLFVMQTSQPVAAWWNHRYVARQLSAASPQISTALHELAGVYEQARYTPPEVALHAEQLERVRLALEQCRSS